VARTSVFAAVAARRLERARAGLRVSVSAGEFYHPAELSRQVERSVGRADVLVIDVGAFFAAIGPGAVDLSRFPRWARTLQDRVRHLRAATKWVVARSPRSEQWVQVAETGVLALAAGALRPLVRRHPRPTIPEYESVLRTALAAVRQAGVRLVLQGPGGFNPDEVNPGYASDTPAIYEGINAMAHRVATAEAVPLVDRIAIGRAHPTLFLGGTSRYSERGHAVMGEVLADHLLSAGVV
jgi:hypothetical protein